MPASDDFERLLWLAELNRSNQALKNVLTDAFYYDKDKDGRYYIEANFDNLNRLLQIYIFNGSTEDFIQLFRMKMIDLKDFEIIRMLYENNLDWFNLLEGEEEI